MRKIIIGGVLCTVLLLGTTTLPSTSSAQTTDVAAMLEQIKQLTTLLQQLQAQVDQLRGQVSTLQDALKDNLKEGDTDDDVKKVQEILASDRTIYPAGLVTGFFGPMTKEALKHFQEKFDLEVTGEINAETKAALETLLEERFGNGRVPPGLLTAPGIRQRFEHRLETRCNEVKNSSLLSCVKMDEKYKFKQDRNDDANDSDNEPEDNTDDEDSNDDSSGDDSSATSTTNN